MSAVAPATRQINVSLPMEVVDFIDDARADRSRASWLRALVLRELGLHITATRRTGVDYTVAKME